jgi:hypothetical protein
MEYRGLVTIFAIAAAGAVPLLPACKGPDPGAITFEERPGGETSSGSTNTSSSGAATTSSGATPDAGGSSGTPATLTDVFAASDAFAYTDPGQTADGVASHVAPNAPPMAGKACVVAGCHADGGSPWMAAGSIYAAITGGAFALDKQVEIGIVSSDGKTQVGGSDIWPDAQGNFWISSTQKIPAGARVGIRKQGGPTKMMQTPLAGGVDSGNCNSAGCHGNATNRIYVP